MDQKMLQVLPHSNMLEHLLILGVLHFLVLQEALSPVSNIFYLKFLNEKNKQ
jgi:hypothetical protein